MTHHDEEGAVGLVLSRPSEAVASEAVPELANLPAGRFVYVGGPVEPQAVLALVELGDADARVTPIVGAVGLYPPDAEIDELSITRARIFAGYSGWSPGQLEEELAEGAWIIVDAEADDAFVDSPDELWRTVLKRKGGRYALIATMPFDPGLN